MRATTNGCASTRSTCCARLRAGSAAGAAADATPDGATEPADDFAAFLSDLTLNLNSTDYVVAFLGDSLRHGRGIVGDLEGLAVSEPMAELARQVGALESERTERVTRTAALARPAAFS